MRTLVTFLVMAFCFALGVFIYQNAHRVEVFYAGYAAQVQLWLVVAGAAMAGLIFAVVIQAIERLDAGRERRRLEKEVEELRRELDRLRRGGSDS